MNSASGKVALLDRLTAAAGAWVDDTELIGIAGENAIVLVKELRTLGLEIVARPNPDENGLQWRLVPEVKVERQEPEGMPMRRENGKYTLVDPVTCFECGGLYRIRSEHEHGDQHVRWLASQRKKLQSALSDSVEIVDEPAEPFMRDPTTVKLTFGEVKVCPRCRGIKRPGRHDRRGNYLPPDDLCMDPDEKEKPCRQCRGYGVVQVGKKEAKGDGPEAA